MLQDKLKKNVARITGPLVLRLETLLCNALCVVERGVLAKHFAGMIAVRKLAL